jgi:hypothetical protein
VVALYSVKVVSETPSTRRSAMSIEKKSLVIKKAATTSKANSIKSRRVDLSKPAPRQAIMAKKLVENPGAVDIYVNLGH